MADTTEQTKTSVKLVYWLLLIAGAGVALYFYLKSDNKKYQQLAKAREAKELKRLAELENVPEN